MFQHIDTYDGTNKRSHASSWRVYFRSTLASGSCGAGRLLDWPTMQPYPNIDRCYSYGTIRPRNELNNRSDQLFRSFQSFLLFFECGAFFVFSKLSSSLPFLHFLRAPRITTFAGGKRQSCRFQTTTPGTSAAILESSHHSGFSRNVARILYLSLKYRVVSWALAPELYRRYQFFLHKISNDPKLSDQILTYSAHPSRSLYRPDARSRILLLLRADPQTCHHSYIMCGTTWK
jgi:hypothetical protein